MSFGEFFNQPINQKVDMLPRSLTHLRLGHMFNQNIDMLPLSLTHLTLLTLIGQFNHPLVLPPKLTYLNFNSTLWSPITHVPTSLVHLTIHKNYKHWEQLPPTIAEVVVVSETINWYKVTTAFLFDKFNDYYTFVHPFLQSVSI